MKKKTEDRGQKEISNKQRAMSNEDREQKTENIKQSHKEDIDADTRTAIYYEEEKKKIEERDKESLSQSKELAPYQNGQPYDRIRVMDEIRFYMNQTVQGIVEIGKRLIVLKEKEKGNFCKNVDEIGISRITAWRFMAIANKLVNVSRVKHLQILDLKQGIGKLYAFLDIPDEELKEFEETGELRGLTIDEIDALPVKELKERLKKKDKQVEQGILQLQEAEGRVKALEQKIYSLENPKIYTDEEQKFRDIIIQLGMDFESILVRIKGQIGYDNPKRDEVPQKALRDLFYLLIFIQKEAQDEKLKLCQFYEGGDDVAWDLMPGEIPPDEIIYANTLHVKKMDEMIKKHRDKKL